MFDTAALFGKMARTEEEVVGMKPVTLHLGKQKYEVPILTTAKAQAYREKFVEILGSVVEEIKQEVTTNDAFQHGMAFMFLRFPDKLQEAVRAYDVEKCVPWDGLEATDEQYAHAFGKVILVAFPFAKELAMVTSVLGKAAAFRR
jgi:hypothetical protein